MDTIFRTPELWAAHYYLLIGDEKRDSDELVEPFFGIAEEVVWQSYQQLVQPEDGVKTLWLALTEGFSAGVAFVDGGEDGHEVRYFLGHSSWEEPELLGFDSAHFALPAFRWPEVRLIHEALRTHHAETAAAAALLLFPSVYLTASDLEMPVGEDLKRWWRVLDMAEPAQLDLLVQNIVAYRSVPEVKWRLDPRLGWINDSVYSFRNPESTMCDFSETRFARVRSFLETMEHHRSASSS